MGHQLNKIEILEQIAEYWNSVGISYAVVHGLEEYPQKVGRDLDVVVDRSDLKNALEISANYFNSKGFTTVVPPNPWNSEWIFAFHEDICIEIDFIPFLSWGPALLVGEPDPSFRIGPFKIDPWASFVKRVLIYILSKNIPKEPWLNPEEETIAIQKCSIFFGKKMAHILIDGLKRKDYNSVKKLFPKLQMQIIFRCLANVFVAIKQIIPWIKREISPHFTQCAPIIAIVGPDGVGKTTIIRELLDIVPSCFVETRIRHWRPGLFPQLSNILSRANLPEYDSEGNKPRKKPGKLNFLRLLYYGADFILGRFIIDNYDSSRLRLVVYDRCALDMAVHPVRYGLSSVFGAKLLWCLTPKPDMTIVLYDNATRIRARKLELEKHEIENQLDAWLDLYEKGDVNAVISIDGTPRRIATYINNLIMQVFADKNILRSHQKRKDILWLNSILMCDFTASMPRTGLHENNKSWKSEGRFFLLRLKDGRGFLIPLYSRKTTYKILMNMYYAQNFRAKLYKKIIGMGLHFGIAYKLLQKWKLDMRQNVKQKEISLAMFDYIKEVMGRDDLFFGISYGPSGAHRKPVIHIFSRNCKSLAYAKIGWENKTICDVKNEIKALNFIKGINKSFNVPKVLSNGWHNESFLCIQSAPLFETHPAPRKMSSLYIGVIKELADFGLNWINIIESSYWKILQQRISQVKNKYHANILELGSERLLQLLRPESRFPFHLCHGDLAPWNAKMIKNKLYLFDWEYSKKDAPVGWDLFHFIVQTLWLIEKRSALNICEAFKTGGEAEVWFHQYLQSIKVDKEFMYPSFLIYLLDRLSLYASEDLSCPKTISYLSKMLNILIYRGDWFAL